MMGVRADITPQVARIDSHRISLLPAQPTRPCYIGSVLRTHSEVAGGSRSPIQVGAELFGHAGIESDFEVIALMIETLQLAGAKKIVLDLGHVGILRALVSKVGLSAKQEATYLDQLERKSLPEIDSWLAASSFDDATRDLLSGLPELHGDASLLDSDAAKKLAAGGGTEVLLALDYLKQLISKLQQTYPSLGINLDLAEMRGYAYHTGIVYAAYIPENGREIARGGRYDGIGENFGNSRPATGFSCNLRNLLALSALTNQPESPKNAGILAPVSDDAELLVLINKLRASGEIVIRQLVTLDQVSANTQGCNRLIENSSGTWQVVAAT